MTLAGFSGLFAAFRHGQGGQFGDAERLALLYLLTASLGAVVFSLMPIPLRLFGISDAALWLIACSGLGAFLAATTLWVQRRGSRLTRFPRVFWTMLTVSWGFSLLQFLGVSGFFDLPRIAVFAAGLWWLIASASLQFLGQTIAATRSQV